MEAVANVLIEKLVEGLLVEGSYVLEFHKNFVKLKDELLLMKGFLQDIDAVRKKDERETLKTITRKLRELLYEAEDMIAFWQLSVEHHHKRTSSFSSCFSPSLLKSRYKMGRKVNQMNQEIREIQKQMRTYLPSTPSLPKQEHQPRKYPILAIEEDQVVGLDEDVSKIKGIFRDAKEGQLTMVGIVGMGGIGKTTLAQKIKNNVEVKEWFNKYVVFVTVSQTFKLDELIKNMLRELDDEKWDLSHLDVQGLLEELNHQLDGKRYLIILDDVWGVDGTVSWWESLKSALPQKKSVGCCVMVTTRNEGVARSMGGKNMAIHHPRMLSPEESWSLFAKIAFASEGGHCPNSVIERLGNEIVGQCGGLPLVIRVVAGMMSQKEYSRIEWEQISKHLKEELAATAEDGKILNILELSYEELPAHLKPCLLCLAAFPEDEEILSHLVINWWIGEGFVRRRAGKSAYEVGEEYVGELSNRCLIICEEKDLWEKKIGVFRVHDMVRDMIIKIAKYENFLGVDDVGALSCTNTSRRIRVSGSSKLDEVNKTDFKSFRTVIVNDLSENSEFALHIAPKLCQCKTLRVLWIAFNFDYNSWSRGFENQNLRFTWKDVIISLPLLVCLTIALSQSLDSLQDSIGTLKNLQVFELIVCNVKRLPTEVTCLEKLTTLILHECDFITYFPKRIGKLLNLHTLVGYVPATSNIEDGSRFSELKTLTQLQELGFLIHNEDQFEEGEFLGVLSEIKQLKKLGIEFQIGERDPQQIISKLGYELPRPLLQLQQLLLLYYPGRTTPAWLAPNYFPNLASLSTAGGKIAFFDEAFFGSNDKSLWKVEHLELKYNENRGY